MIPAGLCQCGCGQRTTIARVNNAHLGLVKGQPRKFVQHHGLKGEHNGKWNGGRTVDSNGYVLVRRIGHPRANVIGYVKEHILIVDAVRGGKPLPAGAEIHHFNRDRADNRHQNLIVCQDHDYHCLLERRQDAMNACGNPNYFKCPFCKTWDDPANMYMRPSGREGFHSACNREDRRRRTARKRAQLAEVA